jgi:aryl-alcohol dehydrogenase-like predicted oxidoreductase
MLTRRFKDRAVGEIGLGTWAIGGGRPTGYGATDDEQSRAAIRKALECGVTFFDTADVYGCGRAESLLSELLPRDVFVATKVGAEVVDGALRPNFNPDYLRRAVEASLGRLRRDALDLVQLHNAPLDVIQEGGAIEALRRGGMTRHVGVSVRTVAEARAAVEAGVDAVQIVFNYLQTEVADAILPAAARAGVAVIAREPLGRGLLTGKFRADAVFAPNDIRARWSRDELARLVAQVDEFTALLAPGLTPARAALKFVLARPEVTVAIPGAKTPAQVAENCAASDGRLDLAGDIFDEAALEEGLGGDA